MILELKEENKKLKIIDGKNLGQHTDKIHLTILWASI